MDYVIIKSGRRFAVVTDYGTDTALGKRQGFWCADRAGGWGTGRSAQAAVSACVQPVVYAARRDALESVADAQEAAGY